MSEEETAARVHAVGPAYAAEFRKQTGKAWRYLDPRKPGESNWYNDSHFSLTEIESGIVLSLHHNSHDKKVNCSAVMPDMPNGGPHGARAAFRDFYIQDDKGGTLKVTPDAGVAFDRFLSEVPTCARRFLKLVYAPMVVYWPQIQERIAGRIEAFAERDRVAAAIAREFKGTVKSDVAGRGSESAYVHLPSPLTGVEVAAGGHIRMNYPPSFNLHTLRGYFTACLTQPKESKK